MSNYLNHLVARSLNQIDTVQPLVRSMFEPPSESADLVEEADLNGEQLALTASWEKTEMATDWETQLSTVASVEEQWDWQMPVSYLYAPDALDYPQPTDFTSSPAEYPGQGSALTPQWRDQNNWEPSLGQEDRVIPSATKRALLPPGRQSLTPDIEVEANTVPSSPDAEQQRQLAPKTSGQQPVEINRLVSSSESSEIMSAPLLSSQPALEPEVIVLNTQRVQPISEIEPMTRTIAREANPARSHPNPTHQGQVAPESSRKPPIEIHQVVSSSEPLDVMNLPPSLSQPHSQAGGSPSTPDRQRWTSAIARTTNPVRLHPDPEQAEMSAPNSSQRQPVEPHRVVSSLHEPEVVKLQPSTTQQQPEGERQTVQRQPESTRVQPTTDVVPSPTQNRQRWTSTITQATNPVRLNPSTQPPEMSAPKSSQQQPVEPHRVTSSLRLPEVEKQTATDRVRSLVDRQPLKPVETQSNAIPASPSAAPQTQPVAESAKNQTIETQPMISSERSLNQVRSNLSPTQQQPESAITQPTIDVASSPIPNRQPLRSAIAQEPNATRLNPTQDLGIRPPSPLMLGGTGVQSPPGLGNLGGEKDLRVHGSPKVGGLRGQNDGGWVSPATTEPHTQPLKSAIAREPNVTRLNPGAEQHRQPAPERLQTQQIAVNRVASTPPPATAPFPEPSFVTRNPTVPTNSTAQLSGTPAQQPTRSDAVRVAASAPTPTERALTPAVVVQPQVNVSAKKGNGEQGMENRRFPVKSSSRWQQETHSLASMETEAAMREMTPDIEPLYEPFNEARYWESPHTSGDRRETQHRESSSDAAAPQTVQVNIGRVEIRATQPAAPPRPKPAPAPGVMTLDEYLRRRSRRNQR